MSAHLLRSGSRMSMAILMTVIPLAILVGGIAIIRWYELQAEKAAAVKVERRQLALLGLEGERLSENAMPLEELAGVPVALVWLERVVEGEEGRHAERLILTAQVPDAKLELRQEPPASNQEQIHGAERPLAGFRVVDATDSERLSWFSTEFADALELAADPVEGWSDIGLVEGALRFTRELGVGGEREAKARAGELIARAERVLAALPRRVEYARSLERLAHDADGPLVVQWRAARALALEHSDTGNARRVFKAAAEVPEGARMALAVWGAPDLFAPDARAALWRAAFDAEVEELSEAGLDALVRHDPSATLSDSSIPNDVRFLAAVSALQSPEPLGDLGAFSDALLGLVLAESATRVDASRYVALCEAGWAPSTGALTSLARAGSGALRRRVIDTLEERTIRLEHAPLVRALAERGEAVARFAEQLQELGAHAGGQLSLSTERDASGGLSQAEGERGGLSGVAGDDGGA